MDWNFLVAQLGPRLYRYFHFHGCGDESSDLVQKTLLKLVEKVEDGTWSSDKGSAQQYAFGIALNLKRDWRRFEKKRPELWDHTVEGVAQEIPFPMPISSKLLGVLSEQDKETLSLSLDAGFTHSEIAEIFGLPLGTIKSILLRAKAKLLKHIQSQELCPERGANQ